MSATGSRGQDPAASASPGDADALTKERVRSAVRHAGWPRQPQCKLGPSLIINRFAFVLPSACCEGGKVTTCVPAEGRGASLRKRGFLGSLSVVRTSGCRSGVLHFRHTGLTLESDVSPPGPVHRQTDRPQTGDRTPRSAHAPYGEKGRRDFAAAPRGSCLSF